MRNRRNNLSIINENTSKVWNLISNNKNEERERGVRNKRNLFAGKQCNDGGRELYYTTINARRRRQKKTQWEFFHSICEIKFFDFISLISGGLLLGSKNSLNCAHFFHSFYLLCFYMCGGSSKLAEIKLSSNELKTIKK